MTTPLEGRSDTLSPAAMSSPLSGKRARSATPPEDSCVKRTKVDDDVEDMLRVSEDLHVRSHSYSANYELADEPVMRDETYYLADGSCVLQVEHTLFNVRPDLLAHSFLLTDMPSGAPHATSQGRLAVQHDV